MSSIGVGDDSLRCENVCLCLGHGIRDDTILGAHPNQGPGADGRVRSVGLHEASMRSRKVATKHHGHLKGASWLDGGVVPSERRTL